MNIVLLGPPGAGKGTQANRLRAVLGFPHIASGDLFRAIVHEDTPLAKQVREYMDRGEYVPDAVTIKLVLKRLQDPDAAHGFLLDGFPRTTTQAEALDTALAEKGRKVDGALYVSAPVEVLVSRITGRIICPHCGAIYNAQSKPPKNDLACDVCGHVLERRSDEAPGVVRVRLDTYFRETEGVLMHYRTAGVLCEFDASKPLDEVNDAVDRALGVREKA